MIEPSKKCHRTHNPIRHIVDNLTPPQNHPKKMLNLALGDPTVHGNLFCPTVLQDNIHDLLSKSSANGYAPSPGIPSARKAIAAYNSTPDYLINEDDVIIASGCSGALELVLSALLNEGDNILVPKPAFPLYQVITESLGGSVKYYNLIAEKGWECDLQAMESIIDSKTKAIVINNPSNPCGSNFSSEHLLEIAKIARKFALPIIADEIYGRCVFNGQFSAMHLFSGDVPVISVGGLAKEFIVPGWRVGWLILHDKGTGRLVEYKAGLKQLTQIIVGKKIFHFLFFTFGLIPFLLFSLLPYLLSPPPSCLSLSSLPLSSPLLSSSFSLIKGANTLIQAAIPKLLCPIPGSSEEESLKHFSTRYMDILRTNASLCMELAKDIPELTVIEPTGAMYVMIQININNLQETIKDDADFAKKLLEEENLFLLPGQCFNMPNFIRLVICPPEETIREAFQRFSLFCSRYRKKA